MAIIFQTRFPTGSLDTDFPETAPNNTTAIISGRGIDGGNALTCKTTTMIRKLAEPFTSNYANLTVRFQFGLAGNPGDALSGLSNVPGVIIYSANDESDGSLGLFSSYITARENGAIMLYISGVASFDSDRLNANSAPGTLIYDGRMYGIQVSYSFLTPSNVSYNVVVNNVSVISGTFSRPWGNGTVTRATINYFENHSMHFPGGGLYHVMTSTTEIQIEDTVNIISYPPNNAVAADEFNGCTPIAPPPPDEFGGIYKMVDSKRNDTIFDDGLDTSTNTKIPDPFAHIGLVGD